MVDRLCPPARREIALDYVGEGFSSRRIAGIVFVALLHVVIIYALVSGLGVQVVQVLHQPLEAKIIQEVKPPVIQPPPPPPQFIQPPPPFIPPPIVQIAQPPPVPVIAAVTRTRPVAPPPQPVAAPRPVAPKIRSTAGLDPNQSCTPPEYPEAAEDMEQTGVSVLQFLIAPSGAVVTSRVASSSGHESLDDAAVRALSICKFKPAMGSDGKPQEAWTTIRYVWQLN
jgi:protein TonB